MRRKPCGHLGEDSFRPCHVLCLRRIAIITWPTYDYLLRVKNFEPHRNESNKRTSCSPPSYHLLFPPIKTWPWCPFLNFPFALTFISVAIALTFSFISYINEIILCETMPFYFQWAGSSPCFLNFRGLWGLWALLPIWNSYVSRLTVGGRFPPSPGLLI